MDLHTFCDGIRLDAEARQIVERFDMDEQAYQRYKRHFYGDRFSFFEEVKQSAAYRQLFLYLFVRFAIDAYEAYRAKGIEDDVYFGTFHDIQVWCLNCKRDYGEYGIEEYQWLQEHVRLALFQLGRLQFQPFVLDGDLVVEGRKLHRDTIVLNVHIPEGEPLDPLKVAESFERARTFFRGVPPIFICNSWLLYPRLSDILPPESNIIRFQSFFTIAGSDLESRQAEERIFGKLQSDPSAYEASTTLQRNAKAYMMAGHKLGSGCGIKFGPDVW